MPCEDPSTVGYIHGWLTQSLVITRRLVGSIEPYITHSNRKTLGPASQGETDSRAPCLKPRQFWKEVPTCYASDCIRGTRSTGSLACGKQDKGEGGKNG